MDFKIPSSSDKQKIQEYIDQCINLNRQLSFSWLLEDIYDHDKDLLPSELLDNAINISGGVSDAPSFSGYIKQISADLSNHLYYRDYSAPQGNYNLRSIIAKMESVKSSLLYYQREDICITEGATGAISSIIEYIKQSYPNSEIILPVPGYYGFKVSAEHNKLSYREIILETNNDDLPYSSLKSLINAISDNTKIIVITTPNNPTGIVYSRNELIALIKIAKDRNIFILFDEVFFDLQFGTDMVQDSDVIAAELLALENIIIVRSFSKNYNLPGLRIGYALSKNRALMVALSKIQEERVSFATGSNHKGLILLDSLYRVIATYVKQEPDISLMQQIENVKEYFSDFPQIKNLSNRKIAYGFRRHSRYMQTLMSDYAESYDMVLKTLGTQAEQSFPKCSAFNTFVKLEGLNGINIFDFCINLYLTCGIKVAVSPYFGLNQQLWENDPKLGFWLKVTFGLEKNSLKKGLETLLAFKEFYLRDKASFIATGLTF